MTVKAFGQEVSGVRCEDDLAFRSFDGAVIDYFRSYQDDVSTGIGGNLTKVLHGACFADEDILIVQEVVIRDVQRRRDEAVHIYLRSRAKQNAVGIHQDDVSVGLQPPEDLGHVVSNYPVKGNGLGAGLQKLDHLTGANREYIVIDNYSIPGGDGHVTPVDTECCIPMNDLLAARECVHRYGNRAKKCCHREDNG
ncbi:MAG: hypothetical protein O2857_14325 [Planctomycetota bacterium]|nr:hypothetical protein [Planctomycetota bacterium]